MNGRKAHERIAKVGRATAKPANEHRGVVRRVAKVHVPKDAEKVVRKDGQMHVQKVGPGRRETWGQGAVLPPKGEDLPPRGEAHRPAMLRIADLRPAGVNEDAMLKRADKAAGLKHVVADKHSVPKHGARRIAAHSAAGRWRGRHGDSDRPAWARVAQAGVALALVALVPAGDADLVRRRWLGNPVQVAALDDQKVLAARVIAARAIGRGPRELQAQSISGLTS